MEVKDKQPGCHSGYCMADESLLKSILYVVIKVSIVGWNEDIESGDTNME